MRVAEGKGGKPTGDGAGHGQVEDGSGDCVYVVQLTAAQGGSKGSMISRPCYVKLRVPALPAHIVMGACSRSAQSHA